MISNKSLNNTLLTNAVTQRMAAILHGGDMPASQRDSSLGMHMLPEELLQRLWSQAIVPKEYQLEYQHALRCTFKTMRDATTPLIHALKLEVMLDPREDFTRSCSKAVEAGLLGLSRFPKAATLTSLQWTQLLVPEEENRPMPTLGPTSVLPRFVSLAAGRLAALQHIRLTMRHMTLTCDDTGRIVATCPLLQQLTLEYPSLTGTALEPLTRLASLSSLALCDVTRAPETATFLDPLRRMSTLTSLSIHNGYDRRRGRLAFQDVAPHLQFMHGGLRDLDLRWQSVEDDEVGYHLQHLTALRSLTRLRFDSCLLAPGCPLPAYPHLAKLELQDATLDAGTIKAVAARPHVTELMVYELAPEMDLSGIPCAWRRLGLAKCTPQQLLWLPLRHPGLSLWAVHGEAFDWTLPSSCSIEKLHATLRGAADILARCWVPDKRHAGNAEPWLTLQWDGDTGSNACMAVLDALSPLSEGRLVSLDLSGDHWVVNGSLAKALVASLPRLPYLYLGGAEEAPAFPSFASVLAAAPYPRGLAVRLKKTWSQQAREAILGLATGRIERGYELIIVNQGRKLSDEELSRWNEAVRLHAAKVGAQNGGKVRFQHYLNS